MARRAHVGQFHIEQKQERALKKRAKQLGVSETEIVRRALALVLRTSDESGLPPPDQNGEAAALVESMKIAARKHKLPRDWKLNRERLYEERDDELMRRLEK